MGGSVEVWQERDGTWRWRYREPGVAEDFLSNRTYDGPHAATESARVAYPDARLVVRNPDAARPAEPRIRRRRAFFRFLLVMGVLGTGFALAAVAALVGLSLAARCVRKGARGRVSATA